MGYYKIKKGKLWIQHNKELQTRSRSEMRDGTETAATYKRQQQMNHKPNAGPAAELFLHMRWPGVVTGHKLQAVEFKPQATEEFVAYRIL